jgi:membrane protein YdbS with pleckstrin-like domain
MEQASGDLLDGTEHGLDPRIGAVWAVAAGAVPVLAAAVAVTVLSASNRDNSSASPLIIAGGLALAAIAAVGARMSWSRWRWSAWPNALELRHGVVTAHESLVPYHRIQQIDIERGPLDRMLGLSSLRLRTASASSDGKVPGIPAATADALRVRLLALAGVDDAV